MWNRPNTLLLVARCLLPRTPGDGNEDNTNNKGNTSGADSNSDTNTTSSTHSDPKSDSNRTATIYWSEADQTIMETNLSQILIILEKARCIGSDQTKQTLKAFQRLVKLEKDNQNGSGGNNGNGNGNNDNDGNRRHVEEDDISLLNDFLQLWCRKDSGNLAEEAYWVANGYKAIAGGTLEEQESAMPILKARQWPKNIVLGPDDAPIKELLQRNSPQSLSQLSQDSTEGHHQGETFNLPNKDLESSLKEILINCKHLVPQNLLQFQANYDMLLLSNFMQQGLVQTTSGENAFCPMAQPLVNQRMLELEKVTMSEYKLAYPNCNVSTSSHDAGATAAEKERKDVASIDGIPGADENSGKNMEEGGEGKSAGGDEEEEEEGEEEENDSETKTEQEKEEDDEDGDDEEEDDKDGDDEDGDDEDGDDEDGDDKDEDFVVAHEVKAISRVAKWVESKLEQGEKVPVTEATVNGWVEECHGASTGNGKSQFKMSSIEILVALYSVEPAGENHPDSPKVHPVIASPNDMMKPRELHFPLVAVPPKLEQAENLWEISFGQHPRDHFARYDELVSEATNGDNTSKMPALIYLVASPALAHAVKHKFSFAPKAKQDQAQLKQGVQEIDLAEVSKVYHMLCQRTGLTKGVSDVVPPPDSQNELLHRNRIMFASLLDGIRNCIIEGMHRTSMTIDYTTGSLPSAEDPLKRTRLLRWDSAVTNRITTHHKRLNISKIREPVSNAKLYVPLRGTAFDSSLVQVFRALSTETQRGTDSQSKRTLQLDLLEMLDWGGKLPHSDNKEYRFGKPGVDGWSVADIPPDVLETMTDHFEKKYNTRLENQMKAYWQLEKNGREGKTGWTKYCRVLRNDEEEPNYLTSLEGFLLDQGNWTLDKADYTTVHLLDKRISRKLAIASAKGTVSGSAWDSRDLRKINLDNFSLKSQLTWVSKSMLIESVRTEQQRRVGFEPFYRSYHLLEKDFKGNPFLALMVSMVLCFVHDDHSLQQLHGLLANRGKGALKMHPSHMVNKALGTVKAGDKWGPKATSTSAYIDNLDRLENPASPLSVTEETEHLAVERNLLHLYIGPVQDLVRMLVGTRPVANWSTSSGTILFRAMTVKAGPAVMDIYAKFGYTLPPSLHPTPMYLSYFKKYRKVSSPPATQGEIVSDVKLALDFAIQSIAITPASQRLEYDDKRRMAVNGLWRAEFPAEDYFIKKGNKIEIRAPAELKHDKPLRFRLNEDVYLSELLLTYAKNMRDYGGENVLATGSLTEVTKIKEECLEFRDFEEPSRYGCFPEMYDSNASLTVQKILSYAPKPVVVRWELIKRTIDEWSENWDGRFSLLEIICIFVYQTPNPAIPWLQRRPGQQQVDNVTRPAPLSNAQYQTGSKMIFAIMHKHLRYMAKEREEGFKRMVEGEPTIEIVAKHQARDFLFCRYVWECQSKQRQWKSKKKQPAKSSAKRKPSHQSPPRESPQRKSQRLIASHSLPAESNDDSSPEQRHDSACSNHKKRERSPSSRSDGDSNSSSPKRARTFDVKTLSQTSASDEMTLDRFHQEGSKTASGTSVDKNDSRQGVATARQPSPAPTSELDRQVTEWLAGLPTMDGTVKELAAIYRKHKNGGLRGKVQVSREDVTTLRQVIKQRLDVYNGLFHMLDGTDSTVGTKAEQEIEIDLKQLISDQDLGTAEDSPSELQRQAEDSGKEGADTEREAGSDIVPPDSPDVATTPDNASEAQPSAEESSNDSDTAGPVSQASLEKWDPLSIFDSIPDGDYKTRATQRIEAKLKTNGGDFRLRIADSGEAYPHDLLPYRWMVEAGVLEDLDKLEVPNPLEEVVKELHTEIWSKGIGWVDSNHWEQHVSTADDIVQLSKVPSATATWLRQNMNKPEGKDRSFIVLQVIKALLETTGVTRRNPKGNYKIDLQDDKKSQDVLNKLQKRLDDANNSNQNKESSPEPLNKQQQQQLRRSTRPKGKGK